MSANYTSSSTTLSKTSNLSHNFTVTDQAARWNANSAARLHELGSNDDPSYRALSHLILQKLTGLLPDGHGSVLDVGCGIGFLSSHIASLGFTVVGIDPADQGIEIASTTHTQPHLQFEATSLEDYASNHPNASFDALVANMVLHCVPNHYSFFAAAARLLAADGAFIATLPNPDTYLPGRSDVDVSDYNMQTSYVFEIPFRIHGKDAHPERVLFFHRPMKEYIAAATEAGLAVSDFSVPKRIGAGRSSDITYVTFTKRD